ncbi:MAG: hypothetical protein ACI9WU_003267 [Myxococcota bacterium]|jgi:hypothetical protein
MIRLGVVALAALLAVATATAATPKRVALLVAIDQYGTSAGIAPHVQWRPLRGTVNDVRLLRAELERRGFEVTVLSNRQATRAAIIQAFEERLIQGVSGKDDVALFHFSGHGQQIPDDDGQPDEADGYDESLIPFDNRGTEDYANNLRDEQLGALVRRLTAKTSNVVITLDSCHSGTGTRGSLARRGEPAAHPPAKTKGQVEDDPTEVFGGQSGKQGRGYVLLSATRPEEFARETKDPATGQTVGAFTWHLVKALRRAGKRTSWRQLADEIAVQVTATIGDQHPQIEGDADKALFSGTWIQAPPHFRVGPMTDDGLYPVEAGRLHGLTLESEIGLYRSGTGTLDPSMPLVTGRIERLELGKAWVAPVGESFEQVFSRGGRALELVRRHSPTTLKVHAIGTNKELTEALGKLEFARLVDNAADADLLVDGKKTRGKIAVFRADGSVVPIPMGKRLAMVHSLPARDPELTRRVVQALDVERRRRLLQGLTNDNATSGALIRLKAEQVDAEEHYTPDGKPDHKITRVHQTLPGDGSGKVPMDSLLLLTVENGSDKPMYVTLVELAADGATQVVFPAGVGEGDNQVLPGQSRRLIEVLRVMTAPKGPVTWKLIATEDDVSFRGLEQGVRGAGANALQAVMMEAMHGTRSAPFGSRPGVKRWGAATLPMRVGE